MKKIFVLVFTVSIIILSGCSNKPDDGLMPENGALIDNKNVDYFFYYPKDWVPDRTDEGITSVRCNVSPSSAAINYASISVMAFTLDDPSMLAGPYWDEYVKTLEKSLTGCFELKGEPEETKLNGVAALKARYKGGFTEQEANLFSQIICVRYGVVYLLTYSAEPDYFEDNLYAFNMVADNFYFK